MNNHFFTIAESLISFDAPRREDEVDIWYGQKDPRGYIFLTFGFIFKECELIELEERWRAWIQSFILLERDLKEEGACCNRLDDESKAMVIHWRELPTITPHPDYAGKYRLTARLTVGVK